VHNVGSFTHNIRKVITILNSEHERLCICVLEVMIFTAFYNSKLLYYLFIYFFIFCKYVMLMEMVHDRCSTLLTEFGTALTTILPICSSIVINTVIVTAGTF